MGASTIDRRLSIICGVTAWRVEALVNYFQVVAVEFVERQVFVDAQGRTADGTWLTTL